MYRQPYELPANGSQKVLLSSATPARMTRHQSTSLSGPAIGPLRIVIAGSDWVVRYGLRAVLEDRLLATVVAEASGRAGTLAAVRQLGPDVLLLTDGQPPSERIDTVALAARFTRVLAFADIADAQLANQLVAAGSRGRPGA